MPNKNPFMKCRSGCAACCIYPSISSPIPGMPNGKPGGVRCVQLNEDLTCAVFGMAIRPKVCLGFQPEVLFCGHDPLEAQDIFEWLMKE